MSEVHDRARLLLARLPVTPPGRLQIRSVPGLAPIKTDTEAGVEGSAGVCDLVGRLAFCGHDKDPLAIHQAAGNRGGDV